MGMHLFVRSPFLGREKGERITDPDQVAEILAGDYQNHVAKVPDDAHGGEVAAPPPSPAAMAEPDIHAATAEEEH